MKKESTSFNLVTEDFLDNLLKEHRESIVECVEERYAGDETYEEFVEDRSVNDGVDYIVNESEKEYGEQVDYFDAGYYEGYERAIDDIKKFMNTVQTKEDN